MFLGMPSLVTSSAVETGRDRIKESTRRLRTNQIFVLKQIEDRQRFDGSQWVRLSVAGSAGYCLSTVKA